MKHKASYLVLAAFGMFLFAALAQGPMYDRVIVDLPYQVKVKDTVLEPGEYEIREMNTAAKNRVLHIFKDGGMKLETTVMTVPALENRTPEDTKVVLHHLGNDYYFDKIWIQGKNYGYEFVLPDDVKSRQREIEQSTVVARYEAAAAQTTAQTETPKPSVDEQAEAERQAQAERDRQAQLDRERQAESERQAQAERDRQAEADRQAQLERDRQAEAERMAQAERDRQAQAERDQQVATTTTPTTTEELPATASNWPLTLLGGGLLSFAGMMLRRRA